MKRIINYRVIGETASYILLQNTLLEDLKSNLEKNILTITDSFKGIDAEKIKLKYQIKVKLIEDYINVINYYQRYFEWLSGRYRDSDEKVAKDLISIIPNSEEGKYNSSQESLDIDSFAKMEGLWDIWKI